jgi:hypothetical protein
MAHESESLKLAKVLLDAIQRQIGFNRACAHKSAMGEMPTSEELAELRAAIGISQAARNAFIDHHENVSAPLATPAATA